MSAQDFLPDSGYVTPKKASQAATRGMCEGARSGAAQRSSRLVPVHGEECTFLTGGLDFTNDIYRPQAGIMSLRSVWRIGQSNRPRKHSLLLCAWLVPLYGEDLDMLRSCMTSPEYRPFTRSSRATGSAWSVSLNALDLLRYIHGCSRMP